MSTASFIGVVVKPQDKGNIIKPNIKLFGKEIESQFDEPLFHSTVINEQTEVIRIYHHFDGYPKALGKTLLEDYNTYEKAINLMSFGDASSIISDIAVFYNSWRDGEDWIYTKPKQFDSEKTFEEKTIESYIYLFKEGQWYVKQCYTCNPEWKLLSDVFKK